VGWQIGLRAGEGQGEQQQLPNQGCGSLVFALFSFLHLVFGFLCGV
jgi:hypothetical protein